MVAVSQDSCDNQWPQHLDRAIAFTPQSRAQPVPKACISAETVADCSVPLASALFADCVSEEPVAVKNFSPGASAGPSCRSVTDFDFQCEFCAVPLAFSRIVISSAGQPPPFRTCRLCQPQAASAASCAGHVQVESAIGLAMPATVGGWFLDCSEVGLGSGAGSWVSLAQELCCVCCFVPLSIRPSRSRPLLPQMCQHCFSVKTVSNRPTRRVVLDPYVPSGQPVHKILVFRQCAVLARARLVSESSRILPSLRPIALSSFIVPHDAVMLHSAQPAHGAPPSMNALAGGPSSPREAPSAVPEVFQLSRSCLEEVEAKIQVPNPCASPRRAGPNPILAEQLPVDVRGKLISVVAPSLEGPNSKLQQFGEQCHETAGDSHLCQSDLCVGCGCEPPLAASGHQEARLFYQACMRAHLARPTAQLAVALHDCGQFCAGCLCKWLRKCAAASCHEAAEGSTFISGPKYFTQVHMDDPWLGSGEHTKPFMPYQPAGLAEHPSLVLRSRRTRRRRNRRLRREAEASLCVLPVSPPLTPGDSFLEPGCADQEYTIFLATPIEPQPFEQGAPKTPAEEVETGSWKFCQEVVGRWPGGLGGPADSNDWAPGSALFCASGTELNHNVGFSFPSPSPCQQVGDAPVTAPASLNPNSVCRSSAAVSEQGDTHLNATSFCPYLEGQASADAIGTFHSEPRPVSKPPEPIERLCGSTWENFSPGKNQAQIKLDQHTLIPTKTSLWQALQTGLTKSDEQAIVTAIASLEDAGWLQEHTFEWTVAELVMDAIHGDFCQAAHWAVDDVLANLQLRPGRHPVRIISLNVTKWRKELASWLASFTPDLALLQETHLEPKDSALLAAHVGVFGYDVYNCHACATGRGGNTGGLAILHRKHLDVSQVTSHQVEGNGYQAVMFRVKGFDLYVVNVYLKTGEGFQSNINAGILASLLSFVRTIRGAFVILGDFNDDLENLSNTNIGEEVRAVWMGPGTSTCAGGGQIDFGLIASSLAPCVTVQLDWNTPSRPHAALHWQLDVAAMHYRLPQLKGFKPAPLNPQPFPPITATTPVTIMDQAVTDSLSLKFAALSCAVEHSVYGHVQGRGASILVHRAPMPVQGIPNAGWGGKASSFWCRFLGWIKAVRNQGWHVSAFGQQAKGHLKDVWQGDSASLASFAGALDSAMQHADSDAFQALEPTAQSQLKHHTGVLNQDKKQQYARWLSAALVKGMKPLYKCLKSTESPCDRPFRSLSLQDRVYHRWKQWHDIWCQPVTTDPQLLAEVRARAIEQAKQLQPIPLDKAVKLFRKFPAKAPGADGWTAQLLNNLSETAVRAILDFMHACEAAAEWPAQFAISLIACLPKNTLRERPIALLHVLYRSYVRLRFFLIIQWQHSYAQQCSWDRAMPGGAVLDVALGRLVRGECTRHCKQHMVTLFLDLETFYDRCRFDEMFRAGLKLGYPPIILHQAYLVYSGARYLQAEHTVAPVIRANTGILAGCPAAPSIAKLILHDVAAELSEKPGTSNLDVWIDDLSLDTVAAAPKQTASMALRLFRGLRSSLEARGAQVSVGKTSFVATSAEASKALKAICQADDPAIKSFSRDLGVTSGGTRRRLLGLAAARQAKAQVRSKKFNHLFRTGSGWSRLQLFRLACGAIRLLGSVPRGANGIELYAASMWEGRS